MPSRLNLMTALSRDGWEPDLQLWEDTSALQHEFSIERMTDESTGTEYNAYSTATTRKTLQASRQSSAVNSVNQSPSLCLMPTCFMQGTFLLASSEADLAHITLEESLHLKVLCIMCV